MRLNAICKTGLAVLLLCGFHIMVTAQQNALITLGVSEANAKQQTVSSLVDGRVPVSQAARAFRALDSAVRAEIVQSVLAWAKAYTESAVFRADYAKQRDADKPTPLQPKVSVDDELAKQKAERRKNLEEMKKNLDKMAPDLRKSMEAMIKQTEEQYAKMDADPQMTAMMRQGIEMQRAAEEKSYQERVQAHEKRFPADPSVLIAQRLQQFLDVSKDVDFSAKLHEERGKMKFVDPRYEGKPGTWKLCFRAGKEAFEAARAFATSWLEQIQGK